MYYLDVRASYKDNKRCIYPACDCEIDKADRGWFYRIHKFCEKSDSLCVKGEDQFAIIMAYAITCGVLWIAAGGVALIASIKAERLWIWISMGLFLVGYIIFVSLFSTIIVSVNYFRQGLRKGESKIVGNTVEAFCSEERDKFKRSSNEFLAYSICSFILIGISTLLTLVSLC